ncbi:MAG TPA: PolC-type DNA polymerase III [Candidatus Limnocylindria bacterium]|nr:PolC-type DNA polymerase III [Candidatus Limnocylindria bacterium]
MSSTGFFDAVHRAIPGLEGKLQLDHIDYYTDRKKAVAYFTSSALIRNGEFTAIRRQLSRMFPRIPMALRVASPALAEDFLQNPDKYRDVFEPILLNEYPAMTPYISSVGWSAAPGGIALEITDPFSYEYMSRQEVRRKLADAIFDIFLIRPEITLKKSVDERLLVERQNEIRRRETELLSAEPAPRPPEAPAAPKKRQIIYGGKIGPEPVPIKGLTELSGKVIVAGKVIAAQKRAVGKNESMLVTFSITDGSDSIPCKLFIGGRRGPYGDDAQDADPEAVKRAADDVLSQVQPGAGVKVRGVCRIDIYDKALTVEVRDIVGLDLVCRQDKAAQKRVELRAHTQMSDMDGIMSAADLIRRAAEFGHKAIAITDAGVVQAFPQAFQAAKKHKIKLIPGMAGMMTDDSVIVTTPDDRSLDEPIIVFDVETTGLNPQADRVIEFGAVRFEGGQVTDTFSMLVNPGMPLDPKVVKITGIKDYMLMGEPPAAEILPKFMAFIGDCALAAHNASFDMAFLQAELARLGQSVSPPVIDTLSFSQKLYPDLKRHRLQDLCRYLGVTLKNAHRAVHDAGATAQCLSAMLAQARERGAQTLRDVNDKVTGFSRGARHEVTLLVHAQEGMVSLNRLVSLSHTRYFVREPLLPREEIVKNRTGLLLGSGCAAGELFEAARDGKPMAELEGIASFYDFLEVQPEANYEHLIRAGRILDKAQLRQINETILGVGEKLGIPVVATGDPRFLDPDDKIFRAILKNSLPMEKEGCDDQPPLYFKTTDEMLEDFSWLPEEKAREIVVDNPQKIAARVGDITLYPRHPENLTTFAPVLEGSEEGIRSQSHNEAESRYGAPLPDIVRERLDKELHAITKYGYATLYSIAARLVQKSISDGYMVGSRGSVGSSLVATMCGITEVNPLPPHYLCPACRHSVFDVPPEYQSGVDLPDRDCPRCGTRMKKDGYDIPFEVFLGFEGDKVPDIDLNFCSEYQGTAHAYLEELFGKDYVFRAGTIGTLKEKTAFGLVLKYFEERGTDVSPAEKNRLAQGLLGVKRTTGQHPGGMVILPKDYEINAFTPIQHPANDLTSPAVTTHYEFKSMHDILVKVDVLGHDDPTMIKELEELSGVHYQDVPLDDPQVMALFRSPEPLGLTAEQLRWSTGTLGIPEFGTPFVRGILEDTQPVSMADLIRISGLSHGKEVWSGNSRELILGGVAKLTECICTREDIMTALMNKGLGSKLSFDIMESVRKGKGLTPKMEQEMRERDVPDWFIKSCKKIAYMFPKGHAVAYVTMALRLGWFKVHMPLAYYAAYFTIRGRDFNALTMARPVSFIREALDALYRLSPKELTDKNEKEITALEMVHEMGQRGFVFLPVDLYKSDAAKFRIEGNGLRCPFTSLSGFGESAARGITQSREGGFISIQDLKDRAGISSACIELLRECGALNGLTDSNQVDFFSLI